MAFKGALQALRSSSKWISNTNALEWFHLVSYISCLHDRFECSSSSLMSSHPLSQNHPISDPLTELHVIYHLG